MSGAFDDVPANRRCNLFGVDDVGMTGKQGGVVFATRRGWDFVESVLTKAWFVDDRFKKVGRGLAGATGAIYRVPVAHRTRDGFARVVKFSGAAQDIHV